MKYNAGEMLIFKPDQLFSYTCFIQGRKHDAVLFVFRRPARKFRDIIIRAQIIFFQQLIDKLAAFAAEIMLVENDYGFRAGLPAMKAGVFFNFSR